MDFGFQPYHHEETLNSLCKELSDAGFSKEARKMHMSCLTSETDEEKNIVLRTLVGHIRRLRELKQAEQVFVLNAAANLALLLHEEGTKVDSIFMLSPEKAAEKAADYLLSNVQFDQARNKLMNDFQGSSGVNETASQRILKILNERQQRAAAWLSLYGARAGGMTGNSYRSEVVQPTIEVLKEHIDDLDEKIRKKLSL